MNMKFDVGGNHGKELVTEEFDDNDEIEELKETESTTNSNKNENNPDRKKLIRMLGLILAVIILFILLLFIITSFKSDAKSYEEIESIMASAAESYFADHKEILPKKDGASQTVDVSILVAEGKMKDLSEYTSDSCTGSVKVERTGNTYLYIPLLNCGDVYSSQTLYDKIRKDNDVVSSGYGLYNKNGNYVFSGEKVNNYVQLDSSLWRVVKLVSGNEIVLVKETPLISLVPWDDRYNEEASYNAGLNNYNSSRIKESLDELYKTTDEDLKKTFLSDKDRARLTTFNLCIGKRNPDEVGVEQAVECKVLARDQKIGLLTAADYMAASTDPNCKKASSPSCQNYNYLITDSSWWLVTAATTRSYDTYIVEANSGIKVTNTNMYSRMRPVIHLNSNVLYKSGSGTLEDPYIVK